MKKTLLPIAAITLSLAACDSTSQFTVNGTLTGETTGHVFLVEQVNNKLDTLAKAAITDGKFVLNGTVDSLTDAYLMIEGKRGGFPIFLENSVYTATLNLNDPTANKIEGTASQSLYNQYMVLTQELMKVQSELYKAYGEASQAGDQEKILEIEAKFNKAVADADAKTDSLTKANADTYVAAYILLSQMNDMEFADLKAKYEVLGANAKASKPGKILNDQIQKLDAVEIGKVAPDFTLNTPEGKPLSMHSIKAKVKVIDFWASWCGPCRGENPNVVAMYEELHPKGLEILSVSLDNTKEDWLKAIEDDKLTWNHVSDLKGWNCAAAKLYGVKGIPHLIVLDENNVIVAKNLRGEDLKAKVSELLK